MVKYDRLDMWQIMIDLPSVYQKTFKSRMWWWWWRWWWWGERIKAVRNRVYLKAAADDNQVYAHTVFA